jgi:hypothetical protein
VGSERRAERLYLSGDALAAAACPKEDWDDWVDAALAWDDCDERVLNLRLPEPGIERSSRELTLVGELVETVLGKLVRDALAEYRGRDAMGWLYSKVCRLGTTGAEFVRNDAYCCQGAPGWRLGVAVKAYG